MCRTGIAPQDEEVIQGFYEGLFIKGQPIPWAAWVGPLCYWTLFLLALYLVSICMMVMMRRQWVEHERLLYPMMQAPMAMVEEDDENAPGRFRIPSLLRRPQMWMGFAVPLVVITCNALHSYYPMLPEFNLATGFNAFRGTVGFRFQLSFSLVGFSYFISRELALGIWVFYLLTQIQQGVFNTIGIQSMAKLGLVQQSPSSIPDPPSPGGHADVRPAHCVAGAEPFARCVRQGFRSP